MSYQTDNDQTLRPTTPPPAPIMSASVMVTNKATVIYPINQVKVQTQLSGKTRAPSPSVITSTGKITVVPGGTSKIPVEPQKTCPGSITPILAARIAPQKATVQHQQHTASPALQSKIVINNAVTPGQIPITYEAVQVTNQQQTAIIQGLQQIQTVPTGAVKTVGSNITGVSNIHRIQTNAKTPPVNFQKVKTITSGVSNQATVVSKNLVSRIQVPKSQVTNAVHQMTPITVNQVITSVNNAPRFQQNATITVQKSQVSNQKLNPGNSENHQNNKTLGIQPQQSKMVGSSQKVQAVSRQQSQSQKPINNVKKGVAGGVQKAPVHNHQTLSNPQGSAAVPGNRSLGISGVLKSDNSNNNSNSQLNMTKSSHAALTVVNKNQTVVQQIVPQGQPQQIIQKQLAGGPQRIQGNVNIQPKVNMVQQTLTSLPVNKGSTIINAKIQQSQQQMLLRLEPGKSPVGSIQGNVRTITQKSGNIVKNSQIVTHQTIQRNTSVQPVKIIQQAGQSYPPGGYPPQGVPQKQPGCIKTIPPQKPQQRNQVQSKAPGIKTSLNTNVNTLKTIGTSNATVITQKSSIKTLLPHQQNASSVVVQKSQPIKIQSSNLQQKQMFVASQFTQQQGQPQQVRHGQIKTILPVSITSDIRKEVELKVEAESQVIGRDEYEEEEEEELKAMPHSPVRRMPLPYECLQFVLQDHNYGAPPPRTPPPTSPPLKQQPVNNGTGPVLPHQSFIYNQGVTIASNTADDAASAISSEPGREVEPEGEETETAPEGEGDEEDSITRCICEFEHDDGYMICCDRCLVWQHVDCMGIDRSNIPDEYLCEICRPRRVDRQRARTLQMRKREELLNSDTSSDTSSTSSADTNVPAPPNPKKRNIQQSRKKSETTSQPRRQNNNNDTSSNHNSVSTPSITTIPTTPNTTTISDNTNLSTHSNNTPANPTSITTNNNPSNNNNVTKRPGRREPNPRQTSAQSRKKETVKRGPGKRKGKRRRSINDDDDNQESCGTATSPLRQWIERYEEAVTNHYSPELRARISSIKVNGTHSDLRQNNNNMSAVASGKCRVNVHSNNVKYLMATVYLPPNTPVVELRGKYMLSTQHRPAHHGQGRQPAQRPGPFVFFYRLPREGTEVCVDTRTYGNDARFVRRSCTPNAEVKHCIEKGTLHLYIVTTTAIDKNAEITIRHEQHNLLMSLNSSSTIPLGNTMLPLACACGNPRTCQISSIVVGQVGPTRRSSGASVDNSDGRERRRRGRKNIALEDDAGTSVAAPPPQILPTPQASTSEAPATGTLGATPKRTVEPREKPKEEVPQVAQLPPSMVDPAPQIPMQTSTPPSADTPPQETKKDKNKMSREERKIQAIMKTFERMEKAQQRKQEVQARNAQRKESGGAQSDNDDRDHHPILTQPTKIQKHHVERPIRRKKRKGRARTTSNSQSSTHTRRTRLNSADSDLSSADDDHLAALQSPPLRRPPCSSLSSANQMYSSAKGEMTLRDPVNPNPVIPTAADLLLALANSNVPDTSRSISPDRSLQQPALSKSPTCDSGASSSSQSSTPSTPLSSACLLVAAAVGPLAPGFKFPKTKKAMMNEWLRESPDVPQPPPKTLPVVSTTLPVSKDSPKTNDQLSSEYLNQSINYGTKSLATLVQAANSVSGICDSPPQRKGAPCVNAQNPQCPVSSGSAKKRWLRQAISEECDSPNSRPDSPPSETVAAPPKKRRIARESLSSDNYTPPTTPTPSTADCPLMALGIDHTVSGSVDNAPERPAFLSSSSRSLSPTSLERQIKNYLDAEMKEEEQTAIKQCEFYDICKIKEAKMIDDANPVKSECPGVDSKLEMGNTMANIEVDDPVKMEVKDELSDVKDEHVEVDSNQGDIEFKLNIKTEIQSKLEESSLELNIKVIENTISECDKSVNKGTDTGVMEPNDTETRLEFDNSCTSEAGISSITASPKKQESVEERTSETSKDEVKIEEPTSLDEFDVEAQMKKITGDDGDDYKEKIETSSERDKSFDGIEGLMESSKDSGSSDRDEVELSFKAVNATGKQGRECQDNENVEERAFKEFETLASLEVLNAVKQPQQLEKIESIVTPGVCSSEESMFDSISNLDCESVNESPKIFQSIPPLSERIRKKTESSSLPKKQLDFETAIIESTLDMESVEMSNGEHKTELSSALRQLLEGTVDQEPPVLDTVESMDKEPGSPPLQHINESSESTQSPEIPNLVAIDVSPKSIDPVLIVAAITQGPPPPPPPLSPQGPQASQGVPVQPEVRRLKDPRTAPHERPPPDAPPPIKRKLSISEYRKRKQQSSGTPPEPEPSNEASSSEKSPGRGRSDSASSGTSSLSSDEDNVKTTVETANALTNLALLTAPDGEERKVCLQAVRKERLAGQRHQLSLKGRGKTLLKD
uniref:Mll5 protein n=1 Tax=Fopius arisanus TaxID=64838 RepID=A0A0C9RDS7_9HYME